MFKTIKAAQRGFTIIELLIVIAIIAILAGLVLNNFQGAQAKARDTQRVTDVNNMHSKLEEFYNENSAYPSSFTASDLPGIDGDSLVDPDGATVVAATPVADQTAAQAVADPDSDEEYLYVPFPEDCTDDCTGYVLMTYIERPDDGDPNVYEKLGLNNN